MALHRSGKAPEATSGLDRTLLLAVLGLAVFLRIVLALLNREANDDHLTVVSWLADQGRIPGVEDAWEGFQPKLYHTLVAVLWKLTSAHTVGLRIVLAQLVSATAGIGTLLVARRFLEQAGIGARARLAAFTLLALNPSLLAIGAQATNDALLVLLVTVALQQGQRFLREPERRSFAGMTGAALLAALTKGNGLVLVPVILVSLGAACLPGSAPPRLGTLRALRLGLLFTGLVLVPAAVIGPYGQHTLRYGSPFVINIPRQPSAGWVEKTEANRPGVRSVADALLTFRLPALLQFPFDTLDPKRYPIHRTSLWSQLYGRASFSRFSSWPRSWATRDPRVLDLGRAAMILALFPSLLLLLGAARQLVRGVGALAAGKAAPGTDAAGWLVLSAVFGYLAFVIDYALRYRDFSTMKDIFVFPAVVGFAVLFARGWEWLDGAIKERPIARRAAEAAVALLAICHVADVVLLAAALWRPPA